MSTEVHDMHRIDIVAALHKKGIKVKHLSLASGLAASSLSNVFDRPCPKYEQIIAHALDMEPEQIWPSRYINKNLQAS